MDITNAVKHKTLGIRKVPYTTESAVLSNRGQLIRYRKTLFQVRVV